MTRMKAVRMVAKISAVALVAGALTACETMDGAATSTSETVRGWFQSAKGTFSDSDQSEAAEQSYFAREMGGDLTAADALAIDREGARALDRGIAGTAIEWRNPETGVKAVFIPGDSVLEKRTMTASLKKGVAQPSNLQVIGSIYESRHNAMLRSTPGIENPAVGRLAPGERFTAVGRSHNRAWILVARKGLMVGYVYEPLVAPVTSSGPPPELREAKVPHSDDPDSAGKPAPTLNTILASTPCRNLAYDVVTANGQRASADLHACKAIDGAWEIN